MASRRHQSPLRDFLDVLHQVEAQKAKSHEWSQLLSDVDEAAIIRNADPSYPLVKIGHFDVIIGIGRGGFGIVFKAFDPDLERHVALKLCKTRSQRANDDLMEEARKLARLAHPNIVTVHELGRHEGAVYFAMPYLPENAENLVRRDPPPTWRKIVGVYAKVARGLAAAHREGIAHGDIKPSNILLGEDDTPFIADLGLGRIVIGDTAEPEQEGLWRRAGTLYYMAPETLRGQPCDALADQFSFWVSLWQTLDHGVPPFRGRNTAEMLEAIERCDVRFVDPSVPENLLTLIGRGLSQDPSERFPDMGMVADELERVVQSTPDEPVLDEPPPDESPEFETPERDEPREFEPEPESPPESKAEPTELMPLGEPEAEPAAVGEASPSPDSLGGEEVVLQVGAAPLPSKSKLGSYVAAALLGMGCVAVGWVGGRGQVEVVDPPNDPVPLPTMPCALGDEQGVSIEIDPAVLAVCTYIDRGQIDDADKTWNSIYLSRWAEIESLTALDPAKAADKLAADTMIIVQTFQEWAKLSVGPDVAKANDFVPHWTALAEKARAEAKKIRKKKSGRAEQPAPK